MKDTRVFEEGSHLPIECGLLIAYRLTALAALRSEFPSLNTGLTAEPFNASYRLRMSVSFLFNGFSG